MKSRKILMITPTLGVSPYLQATIDGLRPFSAWIDHVVVAPRAQIPSMISQFPDLMVVEEEARGIYHAIDQVLRSHGSSYLWFSWINDDDILCEGFTSIIEAAMSGDEFEVIFGGVRFINSRGDFIFRPPIAKSFWVTRQSFLTGQIPFTQQGALIQTSAYFRVEGFRFQFRLCADTDLFSRIVVSGGRSRYIARIVASYRLIPGQLSGNEALQVAEHRDLMSEQPGSRNRIWCLAVRLAFVLQNIPEYIERVRRRGLKRVRAAINEASAS